MRKVLLSSALFSLILVNGNFNAEAEEISEDYQEFDVATMDNILGVSPYANDISGYEYIHSTTSKSKKTEFSHVHKNTGSGTDSVSYSVQISRATSANVSSSITFKGMVAEAGVATQVGLGTSTTKATTITWSIPGKKTYKLRAGSNWVKESGTEKLWSSGKVISSKSVSGNWTYGSWSDKVAQ